MATLAVAAGQFLVSQIPNIAVTAGLTLAQRALQPDQNVQRQGARLENSTIVTSNEGSVVTKLIGRSRVAGQVIWQTTFREEVITETESTTQGKGGPSTNTETTTYNYYVSFAIGLCKSNGEAKLGQIWADGKPLKRGDYAVRFYNGADDQMPDPKIEATEGVGTVPAYRGLCYIVFDEMLLTEFGNRIPQINVEVINTPASFQNEDALENNLRAVNIIPSTGEFQYATKEYFRASQTSPVNVIFNNESPVGDSVSLNDNAFEDGTDFVVSLDNLQEAIPNIGSASVVVSWFGTSLNGATCEVKPKIDLDPDTGVVFTPSSWRVSNLDSSEGVPNDNRVVLDYGGTPADVSIREAFAEIKSRGLRAMFYPFLLMDVAGYPWRGRITGSASTFAGTVARTDFTAWNGSEVPYSGPNEWSQRRMIYHYAWLLRDILTSGDVFIVGSEMVGLSDDPNWGSELAQIIADVRIILPTGVKISYAADWSEYKKSSLTPMWNTADFVGIDNYMPLTDWRGNDEVYTIEHFMAGNESGEYWDYFYANEADRLANNRSPITDAQFRQKDIRYWRDNNHAGKEVYFTEFGCPAIDKAGNQPNVFFDPKSTESSFPWFSDGTRNDFVQRLFVEAMLKYWADDGLVSTDNMFLWTWDARPYPYFPSNISLWADGPNWERGHWLNGRTDSLSLDKVMLALCVEAGLTEAQVDVTGVSKIFTLVRGVMWADLTSNRDVLQNLLTTFHIDVFEFDGKLVFEPKLTSPSFTVDNDDFLVDDPTSASYSKPRMQESTLPQSTIVEFVDEYRNYQIAAVNGRRINSPSSNVDRFSSLSIIPDSYAQSLADTLTHEKWVARHKISFSLPLSYKNMDCGNVIDSGRKYKVLKLTYGDQIDVEAEGYNDGVYLTVSHAQSTPIVQQPSSIGSSFLLTAEIPLLDESTPNHWSPRILGRQNPWPGAINFHLDDGSGGYVFNNRVSVPGKIGEVVADFNSGPLYIWDEVNEITIRFYDETDSVASVTEGSVLNGQNTIAVQSPSGEWEMIQFVNATLNGDGSYTLSKLLRGQLGTEEYMGEPTIAGSRMFLVDRDRMVYLAGSASRLNVETDLRYGPLGYSVSDVRYQDLTVTPRGVAYRPYRPVHLRQAKETNGDITLTWIRQTRFDGDNWDGEVPLKEEFERYEIEILDGSTVVETIQVDNATTLTYSEAQQIADFGASQSIITWRIYQMSTTFGRGTVANG